MHRIADDLVSIEQWIADGIDALGAYLAKWAAFEEWSGA